MQRKEEWNMQQIRYCDDYRRTEKINGVVYDMPMAENFRHGIVNGNIFHIIKNGLKDSLCMVFMGNLDYKFHPDVNDDYIVPDIMVVCDRKKLKGGAYYGTPKFIVETLSPSTAMRDRSEKKEIYEKAGVEELWLVSPRERGLEIYYLQEGKYRLEGSYILEDDREMEDYNEEETVSLRGFPGIVMTLKEIFDKVEMPDSGGDCL